MSNFAGLILAAMVVPYFAWGLYTLHRRYMRHHDWPMHIEAVSLAALVLYFALAMPVLRGYLADNPAGLAFALLGLTVSGFALYGHMAVSLTAKLVVDSVTSSGDPGAHGPRLGPAEALERQRDYEGAHAEYMVLARMYPHDVQVKLRLAGVLRHLDKSGEAADWFEKALLKGGTRDQAGLAAMRLAEIAERELGDVSRARRALESYLEQYPNTPDKKMVEARLEGLGVKRREEELSGGLVAMDEAPLEEVVEEERMGGEREIALDLGEPMGLSRLEEMAVEEESEMVDVEAVEKEELEPVAMGLEKLEQPLEEVVEEAEPEDQKPAIGLERME